jgi:hypothetical protein
MAYGVTSKNQLVLPGTANAENPSQLDTIFFTDFLQAGGPSSTSPAQGGVFYLANANGGTVQNNSTNHFVAFGVTASSGTCAVSTGTTSNATGYSVLYTSVNTIPGITAALNTEAMHKWECEALVRTDSTIFENTTPVHGEYRFGFMNSNTNAAVSDGVYFSRLVNGSTNETTWQVVFTKDGTAERIDTTVSVAVNTTYRLYLCVEIAQDGTYTTTYKIRANGVSTEGTAAPSTLARYPTAYNDYMGVVLGVTKAGTASAAARLLLVDYVGARIRRQCNREILLFS